MTVDQFIANATKTLSNADVPSARLDCLVLLEDVLGTDRANLLANPERIIPHATEVGLNNKIIQRAGHVPLAYLRGKVMFYGREFVVSPAVLIPRPESENLIGLLKNLPLSKEPAIADIGTGSGCLGVTAGLEIPSATVWLCDISKKALDVALQNSQKHGLKTHTLQTDLLDGVIAPLEVVLANLPYVPSQHPINKAAGHEPRLALFAGNDGLDIYRRFWEQIARLKPQPDFVITESMPAQHRQLSDLATAAGYTLRDGGGLAQCFEAIR